MTEDARAEVCEINDKVKIYDTISGFYWCTSWNAVGVHYLSPGLISRLRKVHSRILAPR